MNETYKKVIRVLENARACALNEKCQRPECAQCELVMNIEDVEFALDFALEAIRNLAEMEDAKGIGEGIGREIKKKEKKDES